MIGRLGCAVALVLALAACGGTQPTQTTSTTTTDGAGQGPTVHFTGGSLPGAVYLGAGPDPGGSIATVIPVEREAARLARQRDPIARATGLATAPEPTPGTRQCVQADWVIRADVAAGA